VVMTKLIIHKWETGEVMATAPLGNYKEKFGYDTLGFQRCDLHRILLDAALSKDGIGIPSELKTSYKAVGVDAEHGRVTFENGEVVTADLVIAAGGIHSRLRSAIGITPVIKQALSCAYRHVIPMAKVRELGLGDIGSSEPIEFWTTSATDRVVVGTGHGGEVMCIYSFFP
jgi:salicylate hydroxylase